MYRYYYSSYYFIIVIYCLHTRTEVLLYTKAELLLHNITVPRGAHSRKSSSNHILV